MTGCVYTWKVYTVLRPAPADVCIHSNTSGGHGEWGHHVHIVCLHNAHSVVVRGDVDFYWSWTSIHLLIASCESLTVLPKSKLWNEVWIWPSETQMGSTWCYYLYMEIFILGNWHMICTSNKVHEKNVFTSLEAKFTESLKPFPCQHIIMWGEIFFLHSCLVQTTMNISHQTDHRNASQRFKNKFHAKGQQFREIKSAMFAWLVKRASFPIGYHILNVHKV